MELCERRITFAISATECKSMSFSRRCCSVDVHLRCGRLHAMPMLLTNLQQAHLGFPDSSTSFVTKFLSSLPLVFTFARTNSRAVFDQRKCRLCSPWLSVPMRHNPESRTHCCRVTHTSSSANNQRDRCLHSRFRLEFLLYLHKGLKSRKPQLFAISAAV